MESPEQDDYVPTFFIGQHESKRSKPVTDEVVRRAHECNVSQYSESNNYTDALKV